MNASRFLFAAGCVVCLILSPAARVRAEEVLIPRGAKSSWDFWDARQAPGREWATSGFDADQWKSGPAPLGYGDRELQTNLSFGANPNSKPVTAYFRRAVQVKDPARIEMLVIEIRRDDGAVVYWNGKEVVRSNMPGGPVSVDTLAEKPIDQDEEADFHRYEIPAKDAAPQKGLNIVGVEVHQADIRSSDLIFDLEVVAFAPGEKPKIDYYNQAAAALAKGDTERAWPLLLKVDPAREGYARFMVQAAPLFALERSEPGERYFTLLDKARAAAPDDMEIVYAWIRARVDARKDLPVKPAHRELPAVIPDEFSFIADTPPQAGSGARARLIPREKLLVDVDDLELILENCYSYLERRGANYRGALDALRASITGPTRLDVFAHRITRCLTVFGDPHSRLTNAGNFERRMPVKFVMDGDRIAALKPDRSDFFERAHPYVVEINGRPAADWLAAAERIVEQASPHYRRFRALEQLTALPVVARELKIPGDTLTITFGARTGTGTKSREVKMDSGGFANGASFPGGSSGLKDGIGYLRIPQMSGDDAFISSLNKWMAKFAGTPGLVIDVRGNGGGTQDAIRTILPWLMKPGSPMKIINIAAYRLPVPLPEPNPSGFLGLFGRGLHPATSKVWTPEHAAQIRSFLSTWEPKWKLPAGKFSDWHVMVVSRESNPAAGHYDKPVVVLQNEECFSATDNFLGALKGHPNVTLMGTASGGGSGRMANYVLPNSRLSMTLCQMASFATTGVTYDGNGVQPDIVIAPKLEDHLAGYGDSVLEAAVAKLKK